MFPKSTRVSSILALGLIPLLFVLTHSQSNSRSGKIKPGALTSMTTQPLRQLITARKMLASLPASAGQSTIITCQYSPGEVRHFWYGEAPAWLSRVATNHPIYSLVRGEADQCPATVTAADQANSVAATTQREVNKPVTSSALNVASFTTKGLNFETELTALYLGDFENARLERDSMELNMLFGNYLKAFAQRCEVYLPPNRVEMTRTECATERVTRNGYGVEISRVCVEYREVGTGLYADPLLYSAQRRVDAEVARNMLRGTFRDITSNNPMGTAMRGVDAVTSVGRDMDSLLEMNTCASAGLKRFQENMKRFALGETALKLPGGETLATVKPKTSSSTFKDSNYNKLVDDLITENSQGWMINRYVRGSVSGVNVSSRDTAGRPSRIVADYAFDGFSGRSRGSVTLEFSNGLPQCLYFFDFPSTCRSPSRRIITAYENGQYQQ